MSLMLIASLLGILILFQVAVLAYQDSNSTNPQACNTGYAMSALDCIALFLSVTSIIAPMLLIISRSCSDLWVNWHRTSLTLVHPNSPAEYSRYYLSDSLRCMPHRTDMDFDIDI